MTKLKPSRIILLLWVILAFPLGVIGTLLIKSGFQMQEQADRHASEFARVSRQRKAMAAADVGEVQRLLDERAEELSGILKGYHENHPQALEDAINTLKYHQPMYHEQPFAGRLTGLLDWVPPARGPRRAGI